MDADEKEICEFLKQRPREFVAAREICRRAGGKWRYRDDPYWANEPLMRLVEKKFLETDASGHFRWISPEKKEKGKKWVSPHIKKILEQSGKKFDDLLDVDEGESSEL